jgi:hypothetical protein
MLGHTAIEKSSNHKSLWVALLVFLLAPASAQQSSEQQARQLHEQATALMRDGK